MRFLVITALVIAVPALAHAQDESRLRRSRGLQVAVIDGTAANGRVVCSRSRPTPSCWRSTTIRVASR